jgi:hypothetical protein
MKIQAQALLLFLFGWWSVLPGGRRHGHFLQMWQFLKAEWL